MIKPIDVKYDGEYLKNPLSTDVVDELNKSLREVDLIRLYSDRDQCLNYSKIFSVMGELNRGVDHVNDVLLEYDFKKREIDDIENILNRFYSFYDNCGVLINEILNDTPHGKNDRRKSSKIFKNAIQESLSDLNSIDVINRVIHWRSFLHHNFNTTYYAGFDNKNGEKWLDYKTLVYDDMFNADGLSKYINSDAGADYRAKGLPDLIFVIDSNVDTKTDKTYSDHMYNKMTQNQYVYMSDIVRAFGYMLDVLSYLNETLVDDIMTKKMDLSESPLVFSLKLDESSSDADVLLYINELISNYKLRYNNAGDELIDEDEPFQVSYTILNISLLFFNWDLTNHIEKDCESIRLFKLKLIDLLLAWTDELQNMTLRDREDEDDSVDTLLRNHIQPSLYATGIASHYVDEKFPMILPCGNDWNEDTRYYVGLLFNGGRNDKDTSVSAIKQLSNYYTFDRSSGRLPQDIYRDVVVAHYTYKQSLK